MKNFILILLSFFSLNAFSQWSSEISTSASVNYDSKRTCELIEKSNCYDFLNCPREFCDIVDNVVLDYVKKENTQPCNLLENTESLEEFNQYKDCDDKFSVLACEQGTPIKNYDQLEVYCAVEVMKVDGKKLVESPEKKAAYEAKIQAEKAKEEALALVAKARKCGSSAIDLMVLRNAQKGLSVEQKKQMAKSTSDIINLLQVGSLDAAIEEIEASVADGVIITAQDKVEVVNAIKACK